MKEHEKMIIVAEIMKWKKSKLLPDHYCDFLMMLYSAGDNEDDSANNNRSKSGKTSSFKIIISLLIFVGLVAVGVLIYFFSSLPTSIQLVSIFIIPFALYVATITTNYKSNNKMLVTMFHSIAAASLATAATFTSNILGYSELSGALSMVFFMVFSLWMLMGLWLKHVLIYAAGLLGVALLYYQFSYATAVSNSMYFLHFYWFPVSLFLVWIAYLLNQQSKLYKHSIATFIISLIYLFAPEIIILYNGNTNDAVWMIAIKVIVAILVTVVYGKQLFRNKKNNNIPEVV